VYCAGCSVALCCALLCMLLLFRPLFPCTLVMARILNLSSVGSCPYTQNPKAGELEHHHLKNGGGEIRPQVTALSPHLASLNRT
jgi:hypothetical protein